MESHLPPGTRVALVDDDPAFRASLVALLERSGLVVEAFPSALAYLERRGGEPPACLILDVDMPGLSGLELQELLGGARADLPIVFVSGHADVPASVRAMRHGAVDFLQKPFPRAALLDALSRAWAAAAAARAEREEDRRVEALVASLSPRELQACELAAQGLTNAEIAALLATKENTVKSLRKRAMDRMGVESLPDLVRLLDRRKRTGPR